MAINVDTVYKTVLLILNKEQRGYMTPEEFNKIGAQVQLEIFEKYFEDLNQLVRSPQTDTEYADRVDYIEQKLRPFKHYTLGASFSTGTISLAHSNVHRLDSAVYNDIDIQRVSRKEYARLNKSPLTKPSLTQPVFVEQGVALYVYPTEIASSTYLSYIKKPSDPVWSFSVNGTLGVYVYNSSGSTNFELHESEQTEVILRILAYAGIVLRDPAIVNAATAKVQQDNLNEKS